jgi:hypothetical protein
MRRTVAVLYCEQPQALARQMRAWRAYGPELRDMFEFLVVDDCSPTPARLAVDNHVRVVRIDDAVPWDTGAARNLAVYAARTREVLVLDADQVLSDRHASHLVAMPPLPAGAYAAPLLVHPTTGQGLAFHRHAGLFCRAEFLETGGYDEASTGYEGDNTFQRRRDTLMTRLELPQLRVDHHGDAPCTRWPRVGRFNARTRDTRAHGLALQASARPKAILTRRWHEVAP